MPFVDQASLEKKIGAQGVIDCCDDDGDGVADPESVSEVCDAADSVVRSHLIGKGYGTDQIEKLMTDKALQLIARNIGAEIAYQRRPHMLNPDGTSVHTAAAQAARTDLKSYAVGDLRSTEEATAGRSANLVGMISPEPNYNFAPTLTRPNGKGGF